MNEYQAWVILTNKQLQLGDRVLVNEKMGHVIRLNISHAQVLFLDNIIGTYPKELVAKRNDLILEKK